MRRLTLVLALVAPAAQACSQSGAKPDTSEGTVSLGLELLVDRTVYRPGDTIAARMVIRNPGGDVLVLSFPTAQRYDLEIRGGADASVWTWSADRTFAQILGEERVTPGGSLEYQERFAAPGVAGTYRLLGRITALDVDLRAEAPFEVR